MILTGGEEKPIALTMGEPAGISGEITLKSWHQCKGGMTQYFVIDDPKRLEKLVAKLGLDVPIKIIGTPRETAEVFPTSLPVLPLQETVTAMPGHPDPANAEAVINSIKTAVNLVQSGDVKGLVTNPIQKSILYEAGFTFPGHTEFLESLAKGNATAVMMLACPMLKVVPISIHVSLSEAVQSLNIESIIHKGAITAKALTADFGILSPRIAVAGLNPHAGESGSMGKEEQTIIAPAIAQLKQMAIDAFGPEPPDTLFDAQAREKYDAVLCMYHDQALIPIKTIAFDHAVNITLGLPFVRTSPDHGTALNIAGTGKASETSLVAALKMAHKIADRRNIIENNRP